MDSKLTGDLDVRMFAMFVDIHLTLDFIYVQSPVKALGKVRSTIMEVAWQHGDPEC